LLAGDGVLHEASEDGELVEHVQHEEVQEHVNCAVRKLHFYKRTTCVSPVQIALVGLVCKVRVSGIKKTYIIPLLDNPNRSRRCEHEHVDDDEILFGQQVGRSLDYESHHNNCDEHGDVEEEEHWNEEEIHCLGVRHIGVGVA